LCCLQSINVLNRFWSVVNSQSKHMFYCVVYRASMSWTVSEVWLTVRVNICFIVLFTEYQCPEPFLKCGLQCQLRNYFCDGFDDCTDGSDESEAICTGLYMYIYTCILLYDLRTVKPVYKGHWKEHEKVQIIYIIH
jgi:hypothetical protein